MTGLAMFEVAYIWNRAGTGCRSYSVSKCCSKIGSFMQNEAPMMILAVTGSTSQEDLGIAVMIALIALDDGAAGIFEALHMEGLPVLLVRSEAAVMRLVALVAAVILIVGGLAASVRISLR